MGGQMPIGFTGPTRAVITIPAVSGVAKDAVKFDLAFATPSANLDVSLKNFFNSTQAVSGSAINGYMSPSLVRAPNNICLIQLYDISAHLDGSATTRAPYFQTTWGLGGGGGTPLPSELSVVLSYHGAFLDIPEHGPGTRPRSRHRGRIYIGPMATSAMGQDATTHRATIVQMVRDTITSAALQLLSAEPSWSVWSRKDAALRTVVGGWCDDAWDIRRSRGELAGTRSFFGSPT